MCDKIVQVFNFFCCAFRLFIQPLEIFKSTWNLNRSCLLCKFMLLVLLCMTHVIPNIYLYPKIPKKFQRFIFGIFNQNVIIAASETINKFNSFISIIWLCSGSTHYSQSSQSSKDKIISFHIFHLENCQTMEVK